MESWKQTERIRRTQPVRPEPASANLCRFNDVKVVYMQSAVSFLVEIYTWHIRQSGRTLTDDWYLKAEMSAACLKCMLSFAFLNTLNCAATMKWIVSDLGTLKLTVKFFNQLGANMTPPIKQRG